MISVFGLNFGFAYPALLVLAPAALGLLIYAYLKRGRGVRRPVATLFLLGLLRRTSQARRNFVPPPRFFFELLLLLLLIAGGAGLFSKQEKQTLAVLIDNSFSMAAIDTSDALGGTLLEQALRRAASFLESSRGEFEVKVSTTSPFLQNLSPRFEPPAPARDRLAAVQFAYAADNLEAALAKLLAETGLNRIAVFTDRPRAIEGMPLKAQAAAVEERVSLHLIGSAPRRDSNLAVSDLTLKIDPLRPQAPALTALLHASAQESIQARAVLFALPKDKILPARLDEKTVSLAPLEPRRVVFGNIPENQAAFMVQIEPAEPNFPNSLDVIKQDNQAWIIPEIKEQTVSLISEFTPAQLGLTKIPHVQWQRLSPEELGALNTPKTRTEARAQIFHRFAPSFWPAANSLFILPPPGSALFEVSKPAAAAQPTRWQGAHPLLKYLNLPALKIPLLHPVPNPPWALELIGTTSGAAAWAGEYRGRRYATAGFELFPYEGKTAPLLSIFTLNALAWLTEAQDSRGSQLVFAPYKVDGEQAAAQYLDESEPLTPLPGAKQGETLYAFPRPGLVRISPAGSLPYLVAVNFFDERESNTLKPREITLPQISTGPLSVSGELSLTRILALIAVALILLDLLVQALRVRKGS